jgi:hypothetical protein
VTQGASAAIAALVPVSLKLILARSATMVSTLPSRSASSTSPEFSSGMTMPCMSIALAMAGIGSRSSMTSATASALPTSNSCASSARTNPQSKLLLMMKPMMTPLDACAVMVQSENLPWSSKLASPCHTPEMKAAFTGPESESPPRARGGGAWLSRS